MPFGNIMWLLEWIPCPLFMPHRVLFPFQSKLSTNQSCMQAGHKSKCILLQNLRLQEMQLGQCACVSQLSSRPSPPGSQHLQREVLRFAARIDDFGDALHSRYQICRKAALWSSRRPLGKSLVGKLGQLQNSRCPPKPRMWSLVGTLLRRAVEE